MVKKKKVKKEAKKEWKLTKKQRRQLIYVVIGMLGLFAVLFTIYLIINAGNNFEFLGLKWDKQKFGEIPLYHTQVEITRDDGGRNLFDLFLRNDPRVLNLPNETIKFKKNIVYFSIDESIGSECKEGTVAFSDLGKFFGMLGIQAKIGMADKDNAELLNMPYITCGNSVNSTVFVFSGGNRTQIINDDNCYAVEVHDCEIIKAAETIIVGTINK